MKESYLFQFNEGVSEDWILSNIAKAFRTAEYLFGNPLVRLHAGYGVHGQRAMIEVSGPIGIVVAVIFLGLVSDEIGQVKIKVCRVDPSETTVK